MKLVYRLLFVIFTFNATLFSSDFQLTKLPTTINSKSDEYPCTIFKDQLIFIRKNNEQFTPYSFNLNDFNNVTKFKIHNDYLKYKGSFLSIFEANNYNYTLFAGKERKKQDFDIFLLINNLNNGNHTLKKINLNTPYFDSYPQFTKNGANIVFSREVVDSTSNIDIFFATFEDGEIGTAKPFSIVNTNEKEITPFIDDKGNLFFARWDSTNYNLYKAEKINDTLWSKPKKLPAPINSVHNEICPVVYNNKIYFASYRNEKDFDIFVANLCLPVLLEINFKESIMLFSSYDKIILLDENQNVLEQNYLGVESRYTYNLEPNRQYSITIINECTNESYVSTTFNTLCNDTSYVKYVIKYEVSNNLTKEQNIPFFLTGYYKPITKRNLNQLKKLFDYNLIGLEDSTNYLEYPSQLYYENSERVEKALNEIVEHIGYFAHLLEKGCIPKDKVFKIEVVGYADPRQLSPYARFFEESINDDEFGTFFTRGMQMTNDHLAKLRAYFTAKEMYELMLNKYGEIFVKNNVKWEIRSGGVINKDEDFLLLRKVNVRIKFEDEH